ncbi:hypothetical protein GOP56_23005 [Brevibacillus sp. 7WMA2]|uniref:hypothetical protein n=1 Tax=Brevibacillus sp. 7WMA2 TaxID=2683193 RepID=UPI0013A74FDA|nr:hypothetical protein [Brevibacillus sp. 7WMA2]QIC08208.1 hypothetical protein GOP56_23005 [Brevibacillus sp. 7WMA2]
MEFWRIIPTAFYQLFRLIVFLALRFGMLLFFFIIAFLLSFIPMLLFGWGPGPSIGTMFGIVLLVYIGYRINT